MAAKKQKNVDKGELVRVEPITLKKVREYVAKTRQSIGGFYTIAAEEKLQKLQQTNNQ